ncbi:CocE/NonD family hydrolase [Variovorax boronicumulans]
MSISRRRLLESGAITAFGTLPLPKIADAQEIRDTIFRLDAEGAVAQPYKAGPLESTYVPMRDGVRLALDIVRPIGGAEVKRDTILVMTRYWRGIKGDASNSYAELLVPHGYAVVVGDVRGSGASFGRWPHQRSRAETLDFTDVLDWIVSQPWSTGRVIGYGNSYTANTADWMVERNHPALKGIASRFADYDPYEDLYFPGGVPNAYMGKTWGERVKDLDRNVKPLPDGGRAPGVRPVGSTGEPDLAAALRDHAPVPSVWEGFQQVTFKDSHPSTWGGASMRDWSVQEFADQASRAGTPVQNWAGWFDAGTAQGSIRRFLRQSNPMNVIIGPWSHGGNFACDPLAGGNAGVRPLTPSQQANDVRFADLCFSGQAAHERGKIVHYYTLGEGWKSTRSWPPAATRERWHLASDFRLSPTPGTKGSDPLKVDPALTDVRANRWATNNDGGKVDYGDRRQFDASRLVYTGEPLTHNLEITGHPVIRLNVTSTREDGSFFAYLEAVKPDGTVVYLTEGQLRALHRKVWTDSPFSVLGPQHSYLERDAEPLRPGKATVLELTLHPISARLPAGYRLRVSLAGSDKATFSNVPANGAPPHLRFHRGPGGCHIDLPIVKS